VKLASSGSSTRTRTSIPEASQVEDPFNHGIMEKEVIRDTQVGAEGDDVPDRLQLQGDQGRPPAPYEGAGTHRFETRMSDEEIAHGLGRDARRASELLHQQAVRLSDANRADSVPRPSDEEAKQI
ncbi:hypothetical protein Vretifemale_5575, partial [Volvox reticuliferus]